MSDKILSQLQVRREGELQWSVLPLELTPDNYLEQFKTALLPLVRPNWDPSGLAYSKFGGITNKLFAVYPRDRRLMDDTILLRLNGAKSEVLIDRNMEILVILTLGRAGLAPSLHCVLQNGMCYGFVPGRHCSVAEMADSAMMRRTARAMARLHDVPIPPILGDTRPQLWLKIDRSSVASLVTSLATIKGEAPQLTSLVTKLVNWGYWPLLKIT